MHHPLNIGPEINVNLTNVIIAVSLLNRCIKCSTTNVYKVESTQNTEGRNHLCKKPPEKTYFTYHSFMLKPHQ